MVGTSAGRRASAEPLTVRFCRRSQSELLRAAGRLDDRLIDARVADRADLRRSVLAALGIQARALALHADSITDGEDGPVFKSEADFIGQRDQVATLPARALLSLVRHSGAHMFAAWQYAGYDDCWSEQELFPGLAISLGQATELRARTMRFATAYFVIDRMGNLEAASSPGLALREVAEPIVHRTFAPDTRGPEARHERF